MIYQELIDFNQMFHHLTQQPVIINHLSNATEEEKEAIKEMVMSRYSSDMISLLPSCRCGATKGEYSVGVECEYCNSPVVSAVEDEIEPNMWFARPEGVAELINPMILILLKNRFKKSGYNIIQWLIDDKYKPGSKKPRIIDQLLADGLKKGSYNNFVEHFDEIMEYLFNLKDFRFPAKKHDYLRDLINQNRSLIFSDYIPIPNKSVLIIEETDLCTFAENIIKGAVDAVLSLVSIDKCFYDQTPGAKEGRTARAIVKLADFYEDFIRDNIAGDVGQFRKHIFGGRANMSTRAVISSITGKHRYDDFHMPWGMALAVFQLHLVNKLMNRGYDLNSSMALLLGHIDRYHPLLDELLQELINESPGGRIPLMTQRNCVITIILSI